MLAPVLPEHEKAFHHNMAFVITRDGFATVLNFFNYYNSHLFGEGFASEAVVELIFFHDDGSKGLDVRYRLPANGNLHVNVGNELHKAGERECTMGTAYARLIPHIVPESLKGTQVSTEFTAEHISPSGSRDFMHNGGGMVMRPNIGRRRSGLMFADLCTDPASIVLVNNYFGPRIPFISDGFALVEIWNHRGEKRSVRTCTVPPRGLKLYSLDAALPDLTTFLDGKSGRLDFISANLARKPWLWFGPTDGQGDISLEHI